MRFLFDNHLPAGLALALRASQKSVSYVGDIPNLGRKAQDPHIMKFAAENGYIVVTRDLKQAQEPWFKPAIRETKASYVFVRATSNPGKEPTAWELCKLLIKAWDDIEAYAKRHQNFMALVKPKGTVTSYQSRSR